MTIEAKICGIATPDALGAAVEGGAKFVGFVFYGPSPRNVSPDVARRLADATPATVQKVGLFVDATDGAMASVCETVPLDFLQLHGEETPERVAAIREKFALPVIKAIRLGAASDVSRADAYLEVADRLLFDARGPVGSLPGGRGQAFEWEWLLGYDGSIPWLLSGGLNASNVANAVRLSGACAVDVSSGVEDRPGHKDPRRIAEFLSAVSAL
ncbi:MAG: phosphoribosylanthranilate isomerase [Rhodospirillaceae bacterium]|nr:MAG: phosphoribosylanthranilate isomerase [Rhodospirillaceae bacterium]